MPTLSTLRVISSSSSSSLATGRREGLVVEFARGLLGMRSDDERRCDCDCKSVRLERRTPVSVITAGRRVVGGEGSAGADAFGQLLPSTTHGNRSDANAC